MKIGRSLTLGILSYPEIVATAVGVPASDTKPSSGGHYEWRVSLNAVRLAVLAELVEAHSPFDRLRANALKRTALGSALPVKATKKSPAPAVERDNRS